MKITRYKHHLYNTWINIRQRCRNPNNRNYPDYGGRGIDVCSEWDDFWQFVEDVGEKPEGCSLDRIDNNKGYSKDNCRWATHTEQMNNCRKVSNAKGYIKTKEGNYQAAIRVNAKKICLGTFGCPGKARQAYLTAKETYKK
jgi:hypothetical protein